MVNIKINDISYSVPEGISILNAAAMNGIEIPNLCYLESLSPFGACGLCSVEIENNPKLVRACSAVVTEGMSVFTDSERVNNLRKTTLELLMSNHTGDCKGPCMLNCPAGTECQQYVKLISQGKFSEAVKVIKDKIPMPASIGRICPHPCEKYCRRSNVEEPISIAALKAFAADKDLLGVSPYIPSVKDSSGKSVAVVGGGPAGLTAAYFLAQKGHNVTVYDAMPAMGGMLRYGIPQYRLPNDILDKEIDLIGKLGVKFINNKKLGQDIYIDSLKGNYNALLLATGAWKSASMRLPGENLAGVFGGIDFLRLVSCNENVKIGKNVAVFGGGNTAMDACRTAIRLGAEKVYVVYRRTMNEMPAEKEEIEEAIEEGVEFLFLRNPIEFIGADGRITAARLQVMKLSEPDESGRRKPIPAENETETIEIDSAVIAIGQKLNTSGLDNIELNERGNISVLADCSTNIAGVFAAGDNTNKGAGIAIEAVAMGKVAAESIDAYLNGTVFEPVNHVYSKKDNSELDFSDVKSKRRVNKHLRPAQIRKNDFLPVESGLTENEAINESQRCLECGCHDYYSCKLIKYADEFKINTDNYKGEKISYKKDSRVISIERDQNKCISCGLCVRICNDIAEKGYLALIGRGFGTVISPEISGKQNFDFCRNCMKCVEACVTGALKDIRENN